MIPWPQIQEAVAPEKLDLVGVAPFPPEPSPAPQALADWVARGYHGTMHYMARTLEARLHPGERFSWARSALVVGLSYALRARPEGDGFHYSRYVGLRDYHNVLRRKLRRVFRRLRHERPRLVGRIYVDTGPLLERDLAYQAGLGWIGKNTNLIAGKQGSYFLLGVLLLSEAVDGPAPSRWPDRCGTCTRCLEACPTDALVAPRLLDARRCLSYLTIEHRGPIPPDLRPHLGPWVFGCDICQEVCPWNRAVAYRAPEPPAPFPTLRQVLAMDDEAFRRYFQGSAVKRAGRDGLLRNMVTSIGSRRLTHRVQEVVAALQDSSPLVRRHAAWALGRLGGSEALQALRERWSRETDPEVRREIQAALRALGHPPQEASGTPPERRRPDGPAGSPSGPGP